MCYIVFVKRHASRNNAAVACIDQIKEPLISTSKTFSDVWRYQQLFYIRSEGHHSKKLRFSKTIQSAEDQFLLSFKIMMKEVSNIDCLTS